MGRERKSSGDIGNIRGISQNTVNFHVKNVLPKMDTGSRTVTALKAARLGIIEFLVCHTLFILL
ncbi:LuxR C-terminal-related transcriptional regulator [Rhizobium mongolense]|uniref:LuxR C-terminal-related transcriptional regulator n=1 Tax=Rhizobium mongolense TaxID=57676 RepID=UPI0034A4E885